MSTQLEPAAWPRRTWLSVALLILIVQLALIFGLSDRSPIRIRAARKSPMLHLAGESSKEWMALNDPTLFALPHQQGFSGPAWLKLPPMPGRSFTWAEEPHWISLSTRELGTVFNLFAATNDLSAVSPPVVPSPALVFPELSPISPGPDSSQLRIEGELVRRQLLSSFKLQSWTNTELLTNTVVQVAVDTEGKPIWKGTLLCSSGYAEADKQAVEFASSVRFAAVEARSQPATPSQGLTWGKLIFEWHTVPTNGSTASIRP